MAAKARWKFKLEGVRSPSQRRPIISDGTVLATFNHGEGAGFRGTLVALDVETGQEKWRFDADHWLNEPAVSPDGFVYVSCFSGAVYKFNSEGVICWNVHPPVTQCNVWKGLLVADKFVYPEIHGQAKFVRALDCRDGALVWTYECGEFIRLSSDGHHVVAVSQRVDMYTMECLDADSGRALWLIPSDRAFSLPLADAGAVYVGSPGGYFSMHDLMTGEPVAACLIEIDDHTGIWAPLATRSGNVICLTTNGRIVCLKPDGIEFIECWSSEIGAGVEADILENEKTGNLLIVSEAGNFLELDGETGEVMKSVALPAFKRGYGMAVIEDDLILAVSPECVRMHV